MFEMFSFNERVAFDNLEKFGRLIKAPEYDINSIKPYFPSLRYEEMLIGERGFIKMFMELYNDNLVFNWISYLANPYKTMEEYILNEATYAKRKGGNEGLFTSMDEKFKNLIAKYKFNKRIVEYIYAEYLKLAKENTLTISYICNLFKEYGIKEPLGNCIAKRALENNDPMNFIRIFYLLTQPDSLNKRNDMLYLLYAKDNKIDV